MADRASGAASVRSIVFRVHGTREADATGDGTQRVELGASTRAAGAAHDLRADVGRDQVRLHLADGLVLRLHPETAAQLLAGPPAAATAPPVAPPARRGRGAAARNTQTAPGHAAPDVVDVPSGFGWDAERGAEGRAPAAASRGMLTDIAGWLAIRAIEVVKPGLKQKLVQASARELVARVDAQVRAGVYAMPPAGPLQKFQAQAAQPAARLPLPAGGRPMLVLIHGTFVETSSTFGALWRQPQAVQTLRDHYGEAIYALDHPTLGASPVENALTLAQTLPEGAVLHLLTHSRGGLVAEVLARVAAMETLDAPALAAFDTPTARTALQQLHACLRSRRIRVARVVRVACPARGTLLASGRLDVLLSVMTWLLTLSGAPVLGELVSFLDAVARQRTDPAVVPGLQAMMPTSGLVQWLNQATEPVPGELRVVAGDLQGAGVGGTLKTLLADAFYWSDNDIVVHTSAMYGGAPRLGEASFVLARNDKASHFDYFSQPATRQAILSGLTQDKPPAFRPIGPLSWLGDASDGVRGTRAATRGGGAEAAAAAPSTPRPVVIVLPGLLGSNLARRGDRIWLGLRLLGGLDDLAWQPGRDDGIEPDGPIGLVYNRLIQHLQRSHEVVAFDFDWRLPLEQEARRLGEEVQAQLDRHPGQPVRLLAHSMGGVLARVMALSCPEIWSALMAREGARLLMLGTPNGGSWAPMQVLSGDDSFGNLLVAWGAPLSERRARQMMAGFPGFIALQAGLTDPTLGLDRAETWQRLANDDLDDARRRSWWHNFFQSGDGWTDDAMKVFAWGVPDQSVLDQAVALRRQLDAQAARFADDPLLGPRCCLVVGHAETTPDGFAVDAQQGFVYRDAPLGGDGRVALQDACLPGVRTWRADAVHGDLPCKDGFFEAYRELLETGETTHLAPLQAPGPSLRGASAGVPTRWLRPARGAPRSLPARDVALALGGTDEPVAETAETPAPDAALLRVRVLNGDLTHVGCPLFIGHYVSMTLTGTERVVDHLIGGSMKASLELQVGHYPEAPGTHQIFMRTASAPADGGARGPSAAIVVGLGAEGRLRAPQLEGSVCKAVLGWLQRQYEQDANAGGQPAPVTVAATLIGSGGYGITAGASARAIVRAVGDANRRAAGAGWPQVAELRFVELYLDRAAEAWRELKLLADDESGTREAFAIEPLIAHLPGAKRRPLEGSYRGADYDLVRITGQGDGRIEFALDSRRARSEVREQSLQAGLVNGLVRAVATDAASDPRLGQTLFRLLVPPALEPYLAGQGRLLLDLNDSTAALPWELLDTRPDPGQPSQREPWALRAGLLRTLQTMTEPPAGRRESRSDDAVLVIGEPKVTRPEYGALPAAAAEAEAVAALFSARQEADADHTRAVLQGDALTVIHALLERDWRVIHVAGHGEWTAGTPGSGGHGGIVLSGEDTYIGPAEIRAMRAVPELVFVNCCHLGQISGDAQTNAALAGFARGQFAAGLAEALIRLGVRCVVAAGWAVGDEAAKVFATTFYGQLLAGMPFGEAVTQARRATFRHEDSGAGGNTWAAYQCYGDPEWRLQSSPSYRMPRRCSPTNATR